MKLSFTHLRTLRPSLFVFALLLSGITSFAQVSQSFDALTTEMDCGNTACDYTDPDATDHVLADQGSPALPFGVVIPVSDAGGGTTLGFSTAFVANGNGTEGFTDGDFFGVMGPNKLPLELDIAAQNGDQAFFMEDTDGAVDMTFSPVFLNGTASPQFSMYYILEETGWETADLVNIRIDIDMCAAATTVTLLNTIGQDIDDLNIESAAWTQLMTDLTAYVDCRATLIISFSGNSGSEEFAIDNIVFTEGALSPPAGTCPTAGAVSASETSVCIGAPFDVTATGFADLAMADNGEQDFSVDFVTFTSTPADPYTGGTSIGTVAFAALTGGGTTASLTGASIADGGSYEVYAILSPAPTDPTCRPSAMTTITVEGTQPVITGDEVQKLSGILQDLEANVSGGTWAFVTNSDGMGMIDDVNANPASLMGTAGRSYTIEYTVDNGACGMASDTVTIIFESATDLALGDIAFVGYSADALTGAAGDGFAFVALTDINAGTTISFTEQGWFAAGGFRSGEATVTVTFCDFYGCGSEFNVIANAASSDFLDAAGNEAGTTTGGNLGLSTSGDQVFAYQGTEPTAGAEENFLTAIQMNSDWDADATSTNTSAEPQVFIDNPGNSLAIMPEVDNATFDCANAPANSDVDATRAAVNDAANWTPTNDPIAFPVDCDLGCFDECDMDILAPVVTCTEFTGSFEGCPNFLGPNTPNFEFFPLPANGMFQSAVGGSFITTIDLSTCITDNCSDIGEIEVTLGRAFEENRMGDSVTLVNVLIFRDAAGNEATDSVFVRITIRDTEAPEAVCQNVDVFLDANGMASITPADVDGGSTDNCAIADLSLTVSSFTCDDVAPLGDTSSTSLASGFLVVTDVNNNVDSCSFRANVMDTIPPFVTCLMDTVYLDSMGLGIYAIIDLFEATDNCDVDFASFDTAVPVDCSDVGTDITETITVSDVNGNSAISCEATVVVLDTIAPVLVCNIDTTIFLDDSGEVSFSAEGNVLSVTEACPPMQMVGDPLMVFTCEQIGENTVTASRSDASGNTSSCEITVTVSDTLAPVIAAVNDTVYLDASGMATLTADDAGVTATDNCGDADITGFNRLTDTGADAGAMFSCDDLGDENIQVEVVATDTSGNTASDTIIVTVLDTISPVLACRDTIIFLDEAGMAVFTNDGADPEDFGFSTDNCGETFASLITAEFDCAAVDTVAMVPFMVADASGNSSSCMIAVTVSDTTRPELVCQDVTVFIDENGEAFVRDTAAAIVSLSDNCTDSAAITIALVAPTLGCDGATGTATLTATDANANTTTCMIGLEPVDTLAPTAICQDVTVELDADGAGSTTAADVDNGSSDNCDAEGLTLALDITDFDCDDLGENMVQLIVTDPSGLMDTCTAIVTVEDNLDPIVTITADPVMINLTDAMPTMDITLDQFAIVTDNCDEDVTVTFDRPLTFGGADIGPGTFELTATDDSGNETIVTINFVVTFDQPNLACVGDINLTLNDDCMGMVIPSMVLTGNTSLIDFFDLDIVVMDSDTTNGPIVDGCGEFVYTISQRSMVDAPNTLGFTGDFAPANWFAAPFAIPGGFNTNSDEQIVDIDFTASTLTISTTTTVFNTNSEFGGEAQIFFSEPATVTFDYDFNGSDVPFDQAFSLTNFNGLNIDIGFNTVSAESGSVSFEVLPGYLLAIQLRDDGFTDPGTPPSELVITNFVFDPTPAVDVLDLDFESCWGIVSAEDKTPPAVATQVAPIDLLCVDIDDNQVNLLPDNVSRCYEVFSATGATVPGTMATALRNALSANVGSTAAVVPTFTDGCTERLEVCVSESIEFDANDPQCNDVVLTRTFTATEIVVCPSASGESNPSTSSSYVITFSRPSLDDLNDENIEEVAEYNRCAVTTGSIATIRADYPGPRPQDFPFLSVAGRDFPLQTGSAVCNIGVTFSDGDPIITCPYTYKFVRTYTVIDWCTPSDVRTFTQVVKVGDSEVPTFTGPTQDRNFDGVTDDDLVFVTNAGNVCAAYIILDGAGVSAVDNCSPKVVVTATIFPNGDFDATPIGAFDVDLQDSNHEVTSPVPVGTHILRYTYTDDCGNTDSRDYEFTVLDGTAPVAICENGLNISITAGSTGGGVSTGIAVLTPSMIDNGSYDDCSDVTLEIARVNGSNVATEAYDQELILTCADLGTVRVGLKVTDAGGNSNFCWMDVLVEDKNIPTCIPPGPMTVTCVDYRAAGLPADITEATEDQLDALFGAAVGIDNCEVTVTSTVSGNVNSCGVGSLTRNFLSTDGEGFVDNDNCTQQITIRGIFDYRVTFPTDEESGCADIPAFDGLDTDEFACDLITFNVTVDTIAAINAPDACFTLRVNYDVINFCEYNQLGECYRIPRDGDGIRNPDTQLLYLNVIPNSTANTDDDIAFLSRFTDRNYNPTAPQRDQLVDDGDDNDGSDDDNDNDSEQFQAANGVGFAYAQDDSRGFFCYVQFIDVYDEDAPTIDADQPEECFAGTSVDCEAEVTLTFTYADECVDPIITAQLDPDHISGSFVPARNLTAAELVAIAGNGTINLSGIPVGTHAVRIRANDGCGNFDTQVIEFCVEGDQAPTPICISQLTVTLMPDGMGGGIAEIWASDYIASDVEDCFGNVVENYSIYTEQEAGMAGFEPQVGDLGITLTCDSDQTTPIRVYSIDSNGSGDYCSVFVLTQLFQPGLCTGNDGTVNGQMMNPNEGELAGVEVTLTGEGGMDMMTMTDDNGAFSFVGLPLGADYTVQPNHPVAVDLAAVTVADVIAIGNVILGIDEFDSGYDYLAADVDQDQILTVGDMVSIQRVILGLDDIYTTGETWGFVPADVEVSDPFATLFPEVININDLEGNVLDADFIGFAYGDVNSVGRSSASLEVDDVQLEAGQTHTMEVSGESLAGFQGTLVLGAGLELVNVTYTGDGALNLNESASGLIAMIFRTAATVTVEVRATESGLLSDLVRLTDDLTLSEGVNANGTGGALNLAFDNSDIAPATAQNELFQNTPNPVKDVTTIRFRLVESGTAVLTLRDAAGRLLSEQKLDGIAGMNRVELTNLNVSGVISYTLTSGDFSATRKMVVVR